MKYISLILLLLLFCNSGLYAQDLTDIEEDLLRQQGEQSGSIIKPAYFYMDKQTIIRVLDRAPSFGMFRDNYFITGIPTNKEINGQTADAKFQISIRQRLTKTTLPLETFLMLTYTQKSFWNIYDNSSPFTDNNYNPGLSLSTPIMRNNQLRGMTVISLEHESNGKDSLDSRSWNYLALSATYFFNFYFSGQAKVWPALIDGENNQDLYKYRGYGLLAFNFRTLNDRFWCSLIINPRDRLRSYNTTVELNFKLSPKSNPYLFLQWYNGYGENLLNYNQYTSMVRIGICMKPPMWNFY